MSEEKFYVGFDEVKSNIVINDNIKVTGAVSYSLSKTVEKDEYGLDIEGFLIEGKLVTAYYSQDINKIETSRYIIDNIEVVKEEFGSFQDSVVYSFKATYARVKYQMTDPWLTEEELEAKGGLNNLF